MVQILGTKYAIYPNVNPNDQLGSTCFDGMSIFQWPEACSLRGRGRSAAVAQDILSLLFVCFWRHQLRHVPIQMLRIAMQKVVYPFSFFHFTVHKFKSVHQLTFSFYLQILRHSTQTIFHPATTESMKGCSFATYEVILFYFYI